MVKEVIEYKGHKFVSALIMKGRLGEEKSYWGFECLICGTQLSKFYLKMIKSSERNYNVQGDILTCNELIIKKLLE